MVCSCEQAMEHRMNKLYAWNLAVIGLSFVIGCSPGDSVDSTSGAINAPHPMNANPPSAAAQKGVSSLKAPAIISNGIVQLGVNDEGHLNVPGGTPSSGTSSTTNVGLRFVPTNGEATAPGCLCEGWGVADGVTGVFGNASVNTGGVDNLSNVVFNSTATTAVSTVDIGGTFRVTHDYRPAPQTDFLYEVEVTIENISGAALSDVRYTRGMDWDIGPNTFSEFVTIGGTSGAANVLVANDNGFNDVNPLVAHPPILVSGDVVDSGPADHGAHFDFGFGALAAGETRVFRIFYGAAGDETAALSALGAVGAEVFSLGQANWDGVGDPTVPNPSPPLGPGTFGAETGQPVTFIFGFSGVGGNPPPFANAGPDQQIDQCSADSVAVTLDGSGSSDPDDEPLTYSWSLGGVEIATGVSPTVSLSPGTHEISLLVNDGTQDSLAADIVVITIAGDSTAPAITVLGDNPASVECGCDYLDEGATAFDECSGDLTDDIVTTSTVDAGAVGSYLVTYEVADAAGNAASASRTVEVSDTTPPEVVVGEMIQIFPPDYQYLTFSLSDCVVSATDTCESSIDVDALGQIISIDSDEPDVMSWADSDPGDDIVIIDNSTFQVRNQRSSVDNGRVYRVTFVVADSSGNATEELYCDIGIKVFDDGGCYDIPVYDGPEHVVYP